MNIENNAAFSTYFYTEEKMYEQTEVCLRNLKNFTINLVCSIRQINIHIMFHSYGSDALTKVVEL